MTMNEEITKATFSLAQAERWGSYSAHPLMDLVDARKHIDAAIAAQVVAARQAGESWELIGIALGTSKQAAQQRYGG